MLIKIDKDVDIQSAEYKRSKLPHYPKSKEFPWDKMSAGDSFFIPLPEGGDVVRLMNRITGSANNNLGAGAVTAKCVEENGSIGVRAWRISDEND
jgi:hypothetical protein